MKINLIAIGKRMPSWVESGYQEYAHRLSNSDFQLNLLELPAEKRGKNANLSQILEREGTALLKAVPTGDHIIAFDRLGKNISTVALAKQLTTWRDGAQDISLLIGGPEGISPDCLSKAQSKWSLSALTLPHPLVRIIVAEQIYRAWSIMTQHPYHR